MSKMVYGMTMSNDQCVFFKITNVLMVVLAGVGFVQTTINNCTVNQEGDSLTARCYYVVNIGKSREFLTWKHLYIFRSPEFELIENDFIYNSPQLETLFVSGISDGDPTPTSYKSIPKGAFIGMRSLKTLKYVNSRLVYVLPEALADISTLTTLDFYNNSLVSVPRTRMLPKLRIYKLSRNYIIEIPNRIFSDLNVLRTLDLSWNKIRSLGRYSFDQLFALRNLYLNGNQLTELSSDGIHYLPSLNRLQLANNEFRMVPQFINGTRLTKLHLEHNVLTEVASASFEKFANLSYLNISHNSLRAIPPDALMGLTNLRYFDISYNFLEYMATELMDSSLLISELRFSHNRLTFWPLDQLTSLSHLARVHMTGNPWQCECMYRILAFLHTRNVMYDDKASHGDRGYFTGWRPVCVVTIVNYCIKNITVMRQTDTVARYEAEHPRSPPKNECNVPPYGV